MSQREVELTKDERSEEQQLADDMPIVILPDELDFAAEVIESGGEPQSEEFAAADGEPPEPEPQARQAVRIVKSPPPVKRSAATRSRSEDAPPFSAAELEVQIEEELSANRTGGRRIFSMPWFCQISAGAAASLLALALVIGWEYYTSPLSLRPLHHLSHVFRPSGLLGLSLGLTGALVMTSSLIYLLRKNLLSWRRMGSLQGWMGFHILTGLLGPTIALFHSAFVPTSALGLLAVLSMIAVVGSGIVGRYIAVYFPHSLEGHELKFEEIRGRLGVYRRKLAELGVDPTLLRIDIPSARGRTPWLITSLVRVISGDWESRREFRRLKEIVHSKGSVHIQTELVLFLIKRLCWERQWLVRYGEFRRLVGAWRFVHRWLAVVLFVAILFHVIVAARFGGLWILGGHK